MTDEIQHFTDARPGVPPYAAAARQAARDRLLAEARGRRRFVWPRLGWQAVGAFGLTVTLVGGVGVALSSKSGLTAAPGAAATQTGTITTDLEPGASPAKPTELDPRPGQYILIEKLTMNVSGLMGQPSTPYLFRTHRKVWQPVDGKGDGLLWIDRQAPKQFAGHPIPAEAKRWKRTGWDRLTTHCPGWPEHLRTDYGYLSTLPADPKSMREFLYKRIQGDRQPDELAFDEVEYLMGETYVPRAQREALIEAVKTIPGVKVTAGVKDGAGREGIALGRVEDGVLEELIFDPETFLYLGGRGTVVDPKEVDPEMKAPVGTVVSLTTYLKNSLVDELPSAARTAEKDDTCSQPWHPDEGDQPSNTPESSNTSDSDGAAGDEADSSQQ